MHKLSKAIVRYCIAHRIGILVVGTNRLWKQHASMSKKNNQKFVSIPHEKLRLMISYKALVAGIEVIWQEESYTSKADCTAGDLIPVYGKEKTHPVFSGCRIELGFKLSNPTEAGVDKNWKSLHASHACGNAFRRILAAPLQSALMQ